MKLIKKSRINQYLRIDIFEWLSPRPDKDTTLNWFCKNTIDYLMLRPLIPFGFLDYTWSSFLIACWFSYWRSLAFCFNFLRISFKTYPLLFCFSLSPNDEPSKVFKSNYFMLIDFLCSCMFSLPDFGSCNLGRVLLNIGISIFIY